MKEQVCVIREKSTGSGGGSSRGYWSPMAKDDTKGKRKRRPSAAVDAWVKKSRGYAWLPSPLRSSLKRNISLPQPKAFSVHTTPPSSLDSVNNLEHSENVKCLRLSFS